MPENITDVSQWEANIQYPADGDGANSSVHEPIWQKIGNRTRWLKDQVDATVRLTGNQNITGVKTFINNPVIPDAVNANQPVAKGQLDAALAGLITPTNGGSATAGYRQYGDGWIEMWREVGIGDITNDDEVTVVYPLAGGTSLDTSKIIKIVPIIEARANSNTDAFPTVRTKTGSQCVIHLDEISGLTQNFTLMVYISGYLAP